MAKPRAKKSEPVLGEELTIKTIATLNEQLSEALKFKKPAVVDAGRVDTVDTAALQVLVAFANSCRAADKQLQWSAVSDAVHEQATRLGLADFLSLDVQVAASNEEDSGDEDEDETSDANASDEAPAADDLCPVF